MTGRINSFQSLGTVDGPGVRSVVFMQGCPLRCICCHNPETWDINGGIETDTKTLVDKILRFKSYFGKNGGATVSGGEPLLQAAFVTELFKELKALGINTALDTSGLRLDNEVKELLSYTDIVLLDYKYTNDRDYLRYTLCEKKNVDAFFDYLNENKIRTIVRHVLIPGYNDNEESIKKVANLRSKYPCTERIDLLPFSKLCLEKYEALGLDFKLADTKEPDRETVKKFEALINDGGRSDENIF